MSIALRVLVSTAFVATTLIARGDALYNLTLTSTQGNPGGTGTIALNIAPPAQGTVTYAFESNFAYDTPGYLIDSVNVSFQVPEYGGVLDTVNFVFTPSAPPSGALAYIQSVNSVLSLSGVDYVSGEEYYTDFYLGATAYSFVTGHTGLATLPYSYGDSGTVSITPAIATTPEPASFALLGTGTLTAYGLLRRRYLQRSRSTLP